MIMGFPISTRVMMGVMGFFILLNSFRLNIISPFKGAILIAILSIFSAISNQTWDFAFVGYVGSMFLILFAAYFFLSLFPQYSIRDNSINKLLQIFVICVLIQSVATVLMFIFPSLGEILQNIFPIVARKSQLEDASGFRLLGIGSAFFGAGVVNGLALIIIIYLYLKGQFKNPIVLMIDYLIIFMVGLMMARTTIVGFSFSIFLLLSWKPLSKKSIKKNFKWLFFLILILFVAVNFLLLNANENLLNFAFEFFYNYEETGSFESASTNDMMSMYRWPEEIKTWIIGDGLFNTENGYYMKTDIGFLRLIYYGGIPIMLAYFYFSWYLISSIRKLGITKLLRYFLIICFFYQIALNFKGLVDLNFFFLLIYICIYKSKQRIKAKRYNLKRANLNKDILRAS